MIYVRKSRKNERQVGDTFTIGHDSYIVIAATQQSCVECSFARKRICQAALKIRGACDSYTRSDSNNVRFIKNEVAELIMNNKDNKNI